MSLFNALYIEGTDDKDLLVGETYDKFIDILSNYQGEILRTEESIIAALAGDDSIAGDAIYANFSAVFPGIFDGPASLFDPIPLELQEISDNLIVFADDLIFAGSGDDLGAGDVFFEEGRTGPLTAERFVDIDFPPEIARSFSINALGGVARIDGGKPVYTDFTDSGLLTPTLPSVANALAESNSVVFGNDLIFTQKGDDTFAGDAWTFELAAKGGTASAEFFLDPEVLSEDAVRDVPGPELVLATAAVVENTALFGNDLMEGGNGNDDLTGDTFATILFAGGGRASIGRDDGGIISIDSPGDAADKSAILAPSEQAVADTSAEVSYNNLRFGDDALFGQRAQDELVGDSALVRLEADAGDAAIFVRLPPEESTDAPPPEGDLAVASAVIAANEMTFGDDFLKGGAEDDRLIGDVEDFEAVIKVSGTSTKLAEAQDQAEDAIEIGTALAMGIMADNRFDFGDDELRGGRGEEMLVGDVERLDVVVDGPLIRAALGEDAVDPNPLAAVLQSNEFYFGDDLIVGGRDDDMLIGDLYEATTDFEVPTEGGGNAFYFGNDILIGGKGDDFLVGDVLMTDFEEGDKVDASSELSIRVPPEPGFEPLIVFGEDIFVLQTNGNLDMIVDFQIGLDLISLESSGLDFDAVLANASDVPAPDDAVEEEILGVFIDLGAANGGAAGIHGVTVLDLTVEDLTEDLFMF